MIHFKLGISSDSDVTIIPVKACSGNLDYCAYSDSDNCVGVENCWGTYDAGACVGVDVCDGYDNTTCWVIDYSCPTDNFCNSVSDYCSPDCQDYCFPNDSGWGCDRLDGGYV